jgi:hypothetical protein
MLSNSPAWRPPRYPYAHGLATLVVEPAPAPSSEFSTAGAVAVIACALASFEKTTLRPLARLLGLGFDTTSRSSRLASYTAGSAQRQVIADE